MSQHNGYTKAPAALFCIDLALGMANVPVGFLTTEDASMIGVGLKLESYLQSLHWGVFETM